jgi:hypothetical protein
VRTSHPSPSHPGREAFGRGFHQRNPLVLVAAALLVVLALALVQYAVLNGGFLAVSQGRYLRIPNDDYVHVSYKLAQLRKHPPEGPVVYIFGGSGAIESIVSQRALSHAIAAAGGGRVQVVSLAAHQQTLAQTLAIIDFLPPGKGVLLVGLAPSRFSSSPAQDVGLLSGRPVLLRSPVLQKLAPQLFRRGPSILGVLPGIFDYVGSYVNQRAAAGPFWGLSLPYAKHYYPAGAKGALPLAKRQNIFTVLRRERSGYARHSDYNFQVLREIVLLGRERGYTVVFYDQPLNIAAGGPTWGGVLPRYRKRAQALAQEMGVPYIHVERGIHLTDADFADLYHLLDMGRLKWQARLARLVSRALRGTASPAATPPPVVTPSPAATP